MQFKELEIICFNSTEFSGINKQFASKILLLITIFSERLCSIKSSFEYLYNNFINFSFFVFPIKFSRIFKIKSLISFSLISKIVSKIKFESSSLITFINSLNKFKILFETP